MESYWRSSISQKYKHIRVFRQAINRIHFSETHTEREFGHMLHIENKKRHLSDDLLEGMVRVFFNDPQNLNRHKARKEREEDTLTFPSEYNTLSVNWCKLLLGIDPRASTHPSRKVQRISAGEWDKYTEASFRRSAHVLRALYYYLLCSPQSLMKEAKRLHYGKVL